MDKIYHPQDHEQACYQQWEEKGYFRPKPGKEAYCIMLPPPNVTGTLHMGHGFQQAIMDALTRFNIMEGKETLWQVGTDHAGIATQMVVERQLAQQGLSRHDLGRDGFIDKVWEWKEQSGQTILGQMRRLGVTADWSRSRFTLDEDMSDAVREVFVRLYDEGLIYQGQRLVNWDPVLGTAVSDLEVNAVEEQGSLWHIRYPLSQGDGSLSVATTRPETLFGDVAVAVHPEDDRYRHLIGKTLRLPLCDREIPIIPDEFVDPAFGSGCVKITPAHDFNDYGVGQRHHLPLINILNADATLNQDVPAPYQGLDRFKARQQVIDDLKRSGFLEKIQPHTLMVPRGDRSGAVLEPFLTTQWYVKTQPLAEPAIQAVESGQIRFVPDNWSKTYYQWMNHIEDWCISRQLWWGHRIPAWYDSEGKVYVAKTEAEVRIKYGLAPDYPLSQDQDVLDTWFSSALWPFSTLGWPQETAELATFYPTQVLVTGFDIIFFWVARMIMFGLKFTGKVPFDTVYITGLIRDHEGQKMSKTKGNVIDPIDLIDGVDLETLIQKRTAGLMQPQMAAKIERATRAQFPEGIKAYGTDALRLTFYSLSSPGRELRFEFKRLEHFHHFCNKLWNAARFVQMKLEGQPQPQRTDLASPNLADSWILAALQETIKTVRQHMATYRFDLAVQSLYAFAWDYLCDWYLEWAKVYTQTDSPLAQQQATRATLSTVMAQLLALLHPFMPFITEAIWESLSPYFIFPVEPSLMLTSYPKLETAWENSSILAQFDELQTVIIAIRNIRGEMNISPAKTLPLVLYTEKTEARMLLRSTESLLAFLAKISTIDWIEDLDFVPVGAASAVVGPYHLFIPLEGLIDLGAEKQRLAKEMAKLEAEIERCQQKLANPAFVDKAPLTVVQQEKDRLADFTDQLLGLKTQADRLG